MDSIKKRYSFSLVVNILLCFPRILAASLVPRGLGPVAYGDYQFLINNFTVMKNFLDFGSSMAFFTHNAKNDVPSSLNIQYLIWLLVQLAIMVAVVTLATLAGKHDKVWPGQDPGNIFIVVFCVWLFLMAQQLIQFGDSKGLTVLCQKVNLISNFAATIILVGVFYYGSLTIKTAMMIYAAAPLLIVLSLMWHLYGRYFRTGQPLWAGFSKNVEYFRRFCMPLFMITLAGFSSEFVDRWLLQRYAGSTASGYYSLSYNWAAISLLFFNPMLNIFWREIARLVAAGRNDEIGRYFSRFAMALFLITAFISVFLAFYAREILLIVAGNKFEGATVAFVVMIFFPLIQVCGQLTGSIYLATESTKIYGNIALLTMIVNVAATYFIVAPPMGSFPGLGLGADAYAIKIFIVNFIGTEVLIYFMGKKYELKYSSFLMKRVLIFSALILSGFASQGVFQSGNLIFLTMARFLFYTIIVLSLFRAFCSWLDLPDMKIFL